MAGADGDSSGTNVQEAGVDEPDLVKSQGDRLFVATGGRLVALETGPGAPRELGSLSLRRKGPRRRGPRQLLLRGSRALVLNDAPGGLQIQEIDISNPAAMRVTASMAVDGHLVDARRHDGVARIAIQSALDVPAVQEGAVRKGKAKRPPNPIAKAKPRSLLPKSKLIVSGRKSRQPLVPCGAVRRPGTFGGLDVMTVLTVDLDRGLPAVDSDAVLMSGETVYASADSLFVATGSFRSGEVGGPTEIHRFSIDGATTSYEASGSVPGTMLNQFSMSEHEGVLRVASTKEPPPGPEPPRRPELRDDARPERHRAAPGRPGRRAGPGRADLRRALPGRHGLRRHLPPGRPALRARPLGPERSPRARRAQGPRLLGLPAPRRDRPPDRGRPGRDARRLRPRDPGLPLRRIEPGCAVAALTGEAGRRLDF